MVKSNRTILLVEDDEDDIFIFKRALANAKIDNPLTVVTNGQEAIDYLSHSGKFADANKYPIPFVIFLDLKLPYRDGYDVLTWIRQQSALKSAVVVVLTGSDETRDHQRAYTLGARSYLVKPPDASDIRRFMDSMVSYWGHSEGS